MLDPQFLHHKACAFAGCEKPFTTRYRRQRYCSDRCWFLSRPRKPYRHPRWTHEEIRLLRELAGQVSSRVIAERLGRRSRATVIAKAKQLKISLQLHGDRHPHARHSDAVVEQARDLYDEGLTPTVIAERLGVPRATVCDFVYYRRRLGPLVERY